VLGQAAVAQYNIRNFDMAQSLFEELRLRDPYRTEVHLHFCVDFMNSQRFSTALDAARHGLCMPWWHASDR